MGHSDKKGQGSRVGFLKLWKQRPGRHFTDAVENEMGVGSNRKKKKN